MQNGRHHFTTNTSTSDPSRLRRQGGCTLRQGPLPPVTATQRHVAVRYGFSGFTRPVEGHARAIVLDSAMLGSGVRFWVERDGHTLTVNQVKEPGDAIHEGDVTLRFKTNWVHVILAEEG